MELSLGAAGHQDSKSRGEAAGEVCVVENVSNGYGDYSHVRMELAGRTRGRRREEKNLVRPLGRGGFSAQVIISSGAECL